MGWKTYSIVKRYALFCFFLIAIFPWPPFVKPSIADEIYKWVDSEGREHYSTSVDGKTQTPANLPPIERENIDQRIAELKEIGAQTCDPHGGVDCSAHEDSDGSVICQDGYRQSKQAFQSYCREAIIKPEPIAIAKDPDFFKKLTSLKEDEIKDLSTYDLVISLRNTSETAAEGVSVSFKIFDADTFVAEGEETVEAFGIGEYRLHLSHLGKKLSYYRLSRSTFTVNCNNCRTPIETRSLMR